jgi:hypothetical protein
MMHEREKSDRCVVPSKPSNKAERSVAERVEGRHLLKGSASWRSTHRTQRRLTCAPRATLATLQNWMGRHNPERCHVTTCERSPVRESRTPGSVRGALSNERPYRDVNLFFFSVSPW